MSTTDPRIESLFVHDGFVRALARKLVGDREAADDLAQDAWVEVIEKPRSDVHAPRRWLAGILRHLASKHRRGEGRRRARESSVARAEALPSAEEILEREAVRARLVAAVLRLAEPYRSTILLRYFEDLPPRTIAHRQCVPVETVRTRLQRAHALLRGDLDRECGDRAAWCAVLVPFARDPIVPTGILPLAAMTLQAKIAVVAVPLALLVFFVVRDRRARIDAGLPEGAAPAASLSVPQEVSSAKPSGELQLLPSDADRTAVAVDEPAPGATSVLEPFGSLRVHASWSDGTPAPGVFVRGLPLASGSPVLQALEGTTDTGGDIVFERVPAGNVQVNIDRGGPGRSTSVEAGIESRLDVSIDRGTDLRGIVVDEFEQPVPEAEVVSSEPFDAFGMRRSFVLARTGADGTFDVRSLYVPVVLGARARGHSPSLRQMVSGTEGGDLFLRFVLPGLGGSLTGIVLDSSGEPLADALVVVGPEGTGRFVERTLPEGSSVKGMPPSQLVTRTDETGRFLASGLEPGLVPVGIRARGHATWRGEREVFAGACAELEAWMVEGVDIAGRVMDTEGRPVKEDVRVGDNLGPLGSWTNTDADGAFRLDDVEPGEIQLKAEADEVGRAEIVLHGAPGDRLAWTAVLAKAGSLRGRLVDENGTGLAGWTLEWMDMWSQSDSDSQLVETDAEGRFVADDLHERPHRVEISGPKSWYFPSAVINDVPFGPGEITLEVESSRFPSARIACSIRGEDGKPVTDVQVMVVFGQGSGITKTPKLDGQFEIGPLPPGEYSLSLQTEGVPPFLVGPRVLGSSETWDLGEIVLGAEGFTLP